VLDSRSYYSIVLEQEYRDGEIILEEGKSGDWVCVVLSGSVEVSKTISGKRFILGILKVGEIFGELALIGAVKRTATVRAIGKTTIGIVDRALLDYELNKMSSGFRTILVTTVQRYIKMMDRGQEYYGRRYERVIKKFTVKWKDHQRLVKAFTANINTSGVFVRTDNPLKKGEHFLLELHLKELAQTLEIPCQVRWTREKGLESGGGPPGMGIKFFELSKQDAQLLERYLNEVNERK